MLTVERLTDPHDVAVPTPVFGWQNPGALPQRAYEIDVRTAQSERLVWNSGRVLGSVHVDVACGVPLDSDTAYRWGVRVWTDEGPSQWTLAPFETSLLAPSDWQASWLVPHQPRTMVESYTIPDIVAGFTGPQDGPGERLHPPLHIRQPLVLRSAPARARLFATAHGIYTAEVNGARVGDQVLAPGYDSYATRLSFQTYDVTDLLSAGENVIGMTVADGWWAGRVGITGSSAQYGDTLSAIWQLHITYPDGTSQVICSGDAEAHARRGPVDYADLFIGERYDARAQITGWSRPGFDTSQWSPVDTSDEGREILTPFSGAPIRPVAALACETTAEDAHTVLIDTGQVLAGRLRLTVRGTPGAEIRIEHSEVIQPDGTFFGNIVGPNKDQVDVLVLPADQPFVYEPEFTFHGFRYARASSSEPFAVLDATAVVLASDLPVTSRLETSDTRINQLHHNVVWSQRSNFLSIPTDCPQRERAGWTGDFQIFAAAASTNMDVRGFAQRWLANVRSEQLVDGAVPTVVPSIPSMEGPTAIRAAAGWSDAIVMVPWTLWQRYADRRALEECFPAMRRWVDYQWRQASKAIPARFHMAEDSVVDEGTRARHLTMWNTGRQFGDWLAPSIVSQGLDPIAMVDPTLHGELVTAMFHAHSTRIAAQTATVLGLESDALELGARADAIRAAFQAEYVSADGLLPVDLQGPYVLALAFNLIPSGLRHQAGTRLVRLIAENDAHLDTGFLSTPYLLDVLWDLGHCNLARTLLWQRTPPSWLYAVDHGATTIWESWEAVDRDGNPTMSSFNHYAFGAVDDWLFRRLGGIEPAAPGYARVHIEPDIEGPLTHATASVETVHGRVTVSWRRAEGHVTLLADVPNGATATVRLHGTTKHLNAGHHEVTAQVPPAVD